MRRSPVIFTHWIIPSCEKHRNQQKADTLCLHIKSLLRMSDRLA
jgi:hypothetical protein